MNSRVDNKCSVVEKPYLRSGELAGQSGISADTLRHYERMKLLAAPRRSSGNYRLYPPEAVDRVRLIQRALAVGFSLSELSEILKIRDGGGSPCRKVKKLLDEKLSRLDEQISDLLAMRDHFAFGFTGLGPTAYPGPRRKTRKIVGVPDTTGARP